MFKQARWMLLTAAVLLAGGLARPAAADHRQGEPHKSLPQRHFGTVLADHMDKHCCGRARVCDYTENNRRGEHDKRVITNNKINCCVYVGCCEVGNRGFFTRTTCRTCTVRSGAPVHTGRGSCCCNSPKGEPHRDL